MNNILIVEDDTKLRGELKTFLENSGYKVSTLDKFDNTVNDIVNINPSLILLDINIPYLNGEIVCKELRKIIDTPIIIVTSRNNEMDELISINYGADDFITKPYNTQILLARIDRLLKRTSKVTSTIEYNGIILDISKNIIIKDDISYDLSKNEFKILYYLITNKEKIVTRDELMDYLWSTSEFIDDNTLTVNINRLRSKLESLGYTDVIKTKRGQGYIIYENY